MSDMRDTDFGRSMRPGRRRRRQPACLIFSLAACALGWLICFPAYAAPIAAGTKSQRLFVVFSYPPGQWSEGIVSGLSQQLQKTGVPFELKQYAYDSPYYAQRTQTERDAEAEKISAKVREYQPDFLIVCDDEGADALMPQLKTLKIPLLFVGINKDEADVRWLDHSIEMTGVFERYPAQASLKLLSNLTRGKVKNISLITSFNPTSETIVQQLREHFKTHKTKIALHKVYMSNKWDDWKRAIKAASGEDDSLWMLVPWNVEDNRGDRMDLRVMGRWLSENIEIPSISIVDVNLQMGAMASISMTPQIMGAELADIIHTAILEHKALSKIPYRYPSKYEIIINKKQADRLEIKIPIEMLEYARVIKEEGLLSDQ
ncbi:MAG: hypothetical protein HY747_12785 [Elusimicrobia bacterium]|nr:hypothetical protein [Elusimicrobiota bacterium]